MSAPTVRRRAAFRAIWIAGHLVAGVLVVAVAWRALHPATVPRTRAELEARLRESARAEVQVITTGNLKGLVVPSRSPDVVYELKASRRWIFQGGRTQTNALGFRGREYAAAKPPGAWRVVGLGDSVMFGWGVDQDAIYMSLLERQLAAERPGVEVLNLAVPGYNTLQEAAVLEAKGLALAPDVVLVNYALNDWAAPFFLADDAGGALVETTDFEELADGVRARLSQRHGEMQGLGKVARALDRVAALARTRGLPVVFFAYPQELSPAGQERLAQVAVERGFVYLDLFAAFADYYRERGLPGLRALYVKPEDIHPNPEGHRLIAATLRPVLERLLRGEDPRGLPYVVARGTG
jgi:lysophospholipase L1-like esterase